MNTKYALLRVPATSKTCAVEDSLEINSTSHIGITQTVFLIGNNIFVTYGWCDAETGIIRKKG